MEIKTFFAPLLKWWWLILLSGVITAISCFLIVRNQPPVYLSDTTLLIGRSIFDPNPSSNDIYLGQQLGNLYANIGTQDPIKNATMKALGLAWMPDYTIKPLADSQFIQVEVKDTDPIRAASVATELANQLVNLSPGSAQSDANNRQDFISSQLALTQKNIVDTTNQITQKQNDLGSLTSAHEIAQAQAEIQALQDKLSIMQTTYASLLANSQGGAANILKVIDPAAVPTQPVGPGKPVVILIAGLVGLVLSAGSAYLLEFIDDTIKLPEEVLEIVNGPVIGYFAKMNKEYQKNPIVALKPNSLTAEAFRALRTNLKTADPGSLLQTIMVTSPDAGDGKTSVSVNLAVSYLNEGKRVILVDADFRKPNVHTYFGMENGVGLGEALNSEVEVWGALQRWKGSSLYILTAGHRLALLDKLLEPEKILKLITDLKGMANVIIFDSAPCIVSDAIRLAPCMDGMIFVVRPGHTRRKMAKITVEQVLRAGGNILGAVMNAIPVGLAGYAANYRPYAPFYYSAYSARAMKEKMNGNGNGKEKIESHQNKN
jgi:succinoglycan biosynthesis transport protein ExoP